LSYAGSPFLGANPHHALLEHARKALLKIPSGETPSPCFAFCREGRCAPQDRNGGRRDGPRAEVLLAVSSGKLGQAKFNSPPDLI
jgi:hypothetical protein